MNTPRPTRAECEAILAKDSWFICTKCGWHGPSLGDHMRNDLKQCPYEPIRTAHQEQRLAQ